MTTKRLRVSGFVVVDCSYETEREVDVPESYIGRELEYLQDNDLLPKVDTWDGYDWLLALVKDGRAVDVKWDIKPDSFKPAVAEVIE